MSSTAHRIWINGNLRWAKHMGRDIRAHIHQFRHCQ